MGNELAQHIDVNIVMVQLFVLSSVCFLANCQCP